MQSLLKLKNGWNLNRTGQKHETIRCCLIREFSDFIIHKPGLMLSVKNT